MYGIFVMLFFDAYYTLEASLSGEFTTLKGKYFFYDSEAKRPITLPWPPCCAPWPSSPVHRGFSIPLIPSFVKLDLSDLACPAGTFSLGPVYGVVESRLVKNLLHLPFGSSAGVGELSNFLLGSVFVLVAGLVYTGGIRAQIGLWGLPAGRLALVSLPSNYFVVYPAYEVLYGLP